MDADELREALRAGQPLDPGDLVVWPCRTPEGERQAGRCTVMDYIMMFEDAPSTVH